MKNAFVISTIVRLTLLIWITFGTSPSSLSLTTQQKQKNEEEPTTKYELARRFLKSSGLKSILSNPIHTLDHMREGVFLSKLTPSGSFLSTTTSTARSYANIYMDDRPTTNHDRSAFFHAPPLLLALVDPVLLTWIPSVGVQDLVFGILMMLVDLCTAIRLFQLARNVLKREEMEVGDGDAGENDDADRAVEWELDLERKMDPSIRPDRAWVFGILFGADYGGDGSVANNDTSTAGNGDEDDNDNSPSSSDIVASPSSSSSPPKEAILELSDIPRLCAIFYYCNPIFILANGCGACSFHGLWYLLLVSALQELTTNTHIHNNTTNDTTTDTDSHMEKPTRRRSKNNVPMAMLYLAIVSYVEIIHVIFLLPAILFTNRGLGYDRLLRSTVGCVGIFLLWSLLLQFLSLLLVGESNFFAMLRQSHAKEYNFIDLEPSIGLHWYFFISMFDRFRRYFAIMHFGIQFLFAGPLFLRFHRYPIAMVRLCSRVYIMCLFFGEFCLNLT